VRVTNTLAVVFTDIVGSTEQRVRLGDLEADTVRRQNFATTREIAERHGGREVKNLGDGVLSVFPSASAAVGACIALQQAVERHNGAVDRDRRVQLRVGVSMGEVLEEDGDVFGGPVIEAARLCAEADGGQVLAGPALVYLADRVNRSLLTPIGERELKGLAEPVLVHEVDWSRAPVEAPLPLQRRVEQVEEAFPFAGRRDDWMRLLGAFEGARQGERRLVALGGEPGIGKTRLANQLARHAHAEAGLVLCGRCDPELGHPYLPFVEALRHLVAHLPPDVLAEHTDRRGGELARLVPELLEQRPELAPPSLSDPAAERYELFRAVNDLLATAADGAPLVLVLDDVQWADRATLHLLRDLLTRDDGIPICAVALFRESEVSAAHPLSALLIDLQSTMIVDRFVLSGLAPDEVLELVEGQAGHRVDEPAAEALLQITRDTGGNPFFLTQMLRHLTEREVIRFRAGRWELAASLDDVDLPDSVRAVIAQRMGQVDDQADRLLRIAAVAGQWFELSVVATAAAIDEDDALDAVERAMELNLVQEDREHPGRFGFVHALVRQTLDDQLTATRRARLHLRLSDALEQARTSDDEHAPALARHLCAAGDIEPARVVDALRRAAERSFHELGYEEAANFVDAALERIDDSDLETRADLLLLRGEAYRRLGDARAREDLMAVVDQARVSGDARRLGRAAIALLRPGYWYTEALRVHPELVTPLEDALDALGDVEEPLRAQVMLALASQLIFDAEQRDRAVALCEEAEALAQRCGDRRSVADSVFVRWMLAWNPSGFERRRQLQARLAELTAEVGGTELHFITALTETYLLLEMGDRQAVERKLIDLRAEAASLRLSYYSWLVHHVDTCLAIAAVDPSADQQVDATLSGGLASAQSDAIMTYGAQLSVLRMSMGRFGELADFVDEIIGEYPVDGWRTAAAGILLAVGQPARARAIYDEVVTSMHRHGNDFTEPAVLVLGAELCAAFGDAAHARDLASRLEPLVDRVAIAGTGTLSLGSYARALGNLALLEGRLDLAVDLLERGLAIDERMQARFFVLLGLEALETALKARAGTGDLERAEAASARADQLATELGLGRGRGAFGLDRSHTDVR
jgi:class 3 adenylate cyclase/tetratricopeptide (TPR) repeat protein